MSQPQGSLLIINNPIRVIDANSLFWSPGKIKLKGLVNNENIVQFI